MNISAIYFQIVLPHTLYFVLSSKYSYVISPRNVIQNIGESFVIFTMFINLHTQWFSTRLY